MNTSLHVDFTDTLEPLDAFTITGWLSSRDLRSGQGGAYFLPAVGLLITVYQAFRQ